MPRKKSQEIVEMEPMEPIPEAEPESKTAKPEKSPEELRAQHMGNIKHCIEAMAAWQGKLLKLANSKRHVLSQDAKNQIVMELARMNILAQEELKPKAKFELGIELK